MAAELEAPHRVAPARALLNQDAALAVMVVLLVTETMVEEEEVPVVILAAVAQLMELVVTGEQVQQRRRRVQAVGGVEVPLPPPTLQGAAVWDCLVKDLTVLLLFGYRVTQLAVAEVVAAQQAEIVQFPVLVEPAAHMAAVAAQAGLLVVGREAAQAVDWLMVIILQWLLVIHTL